MAEDCILFERYMKDFFDEKLSSVMKEAVWQHLMQCYQCYQKYRAYARTIGLEFKYVEDGLGFQISKLDEDDCKQECAKDEKKDEPEYWTTLAITNNTEKLKEAKCLSDFLNEDAPEVSKIDETIVSDYYLFIIKKLCQKIDHLETCYRKELIVNESN